MKGSNTTQNVMSFGKWSNTTTVTSASYSFIMWELLMQRPLGSTFQDIVDEDQEQMKAPAKDNVPYETLQTRAHSFEERQKGNLSVFPLALMPLR